MIIPCLIIEVQVRDFIAKSFEVTDSPTMLVLFETPAGYALFKVKDEAKIANADDLQKSFADAEGAAKVVKLMAFSKFADTIEVRGRLKLIFYYQLQIVFRVIHSVCFCIRPYRRLLPWWSPPLESR